MFRVNIDITVRLDGCPERGLGAVDFRRAQGLPEEPTSKVRLQWKDEGQEALCRAHAAYLTAEADLGLVTMSNSSSDSAVVTHTGGISTAHPLADALRDRANDQPSLFHARVPAALAKPFLAGAVVPQDVSALVACLTGQAATRRAAIAAEVEERHLRERAAQADRDAARERSERVQAALKKHSDAADAAAKDRLAAWVREHGSELARLRLEEGYDCWVSAGREEYAARAAARVVDGLRLTRSEAPGGHSHDEDTERKCPTLVEITTLRAAKAEAVREPADYPVTVELLLSSYTPDEDEDGDDRKPIRRPELRVTVGGLPGGPVTADYVIPTE